MTMFVFEILEGIRRLERMQNRGTGMRSPPGRLSYSTVLHMLLNPCAAPQPSTRPSSTFRKADMDFNIKNVALVLPINVGSYGAIWLPGRRTFIGSLPPRA
jgi:hypothetical protein